MHKLLKVKNHVWNWRCSYAGVILMTLAYTYGKSQADAA